MSELDAQIESLPLLQRLALAYAPRDARQKTLGLLLLDNKLNGIVNRSKEPMLAQIRLAWWREVLQQEVTKWPKGEPLLNLLREWDGHTEGLLKLVDGWEMTLSKEMDENAITQLARGRGEAFGALAKLLGHPEKAESTANLASNWAIADLASYAPQAPVRDAAWHTLSNITWNSQKLPRALRPVSVLHGLAQRSVKKGHSLDELTASSLIPAMRIGLLGW